MSVRERLAAAASTGRTEALEARVTQLEKQVADLEPLQRRVAELLDVVTELLVPLSAQDPERAREILARYLDDLGS